MKRSFWFLAIGLAGWLFAGGVAAYYAMARGPAYAARPGYADGPGMMHGYGPGMMGGYGPAMIWGDVGGGQAVGSASSQTNGTPTVQGTVVSLQGLRFGPGALRVKAGTTVTFVNRDSVPHDVINLSPGNLGATPAFSSPVLAPGRSWAYTFDQPGTYPILCTVAGHYAAGMVGQVIVEQA